MRVATLALPALALLLLALASSSVTALVSTPPAVPTPNTDCEGCKAIVRTAMDIAGNQTKIDQLIAILINDCHAMHLNASEEALCDTLATTLVNLLPKIKKGLSDLAWPLPEGICSVLLQQCNLQCCDAATPYLPEQIHLSLTNTPSEMMVSWVTFRPAGDAQVQWGPETTLGYSAAAEVSTYTVAGWVGTIYNALMTGLKPSTTYNYRVGSSASWSRGITFRTLPSYADYQCQSQAGSDQMPAAADFPPLRFAVIGDMAYDNFSDATVARLLRELNNGSLDVVLHAGDISYADGYQPHWDLYMRKIEPIASRVPYMVVPGNHEFWFNFTAYKSRWFMPGASSKSIDPTMFYSVNVGPVHITGFDTETWIDTADISPLQKRWIQQDLAIASGRKSQQPWLITMGHRPLYCSNSNKMNCHDFAGMLQGLIEDTFVLSKVDLVITAHQHDYERSWPTYKGKAISTNYTNPQVPVYLVNGAAGNREGLTGGFVEPAPSWVANRLREYGSGRLTWTPRGTGPGTLTWQFFGNGDVLRDQFVLVKNRC